MAIRQIDIYLPEDTNGLPPLKDEFDVIDQWTFKTSEGRSHVRILVETNKTEALLEWLEQEFIDSDDYRISINAIQTTIPRPEEDESEEDESDEGETDDQNGDDEEDDNKDVSRISRQEVYQDVSDSISVTKVYYTLVVLSTIVATGGMIRDNTAVVIGAMVIAPIIGPNIALALGSTLADQDLLKRAIKINILGLLLGLSIAIFAGLVLPVDPSVGEIATRTEVNIADVGLALAAGAAGVLSVTRGVSTALIGVMVAVALLPPLVAVGLLIGIGDWSGAYGATLLTFTNVVAINLAGIVTFIIQGIRPTTWYEAEKAKRSRTVAFVLWLTILGVLIAAIVVGTPSL